MGNLRSIWGRKGGVRSEEEEGRGRLYERSHERPPPCEREDKEGKILKKDGINDEEKGCARAWVEKNLWQDLDFAFRIFNYNLTFSFCLKAKQITWSSQNKSFEAFTLKIQFLVTDLLIYWFYNDVTFSIYFLPKLFLVPIR